MKKNAFTLIELMIASSIAAVVMVISFALISNVYLARKQIRIAQNFYGESRFLLEEIVNITRNNTIDYDKYFEEIGPENCNSFSNSGIQNTKDNRINIGYPNIFYWKIGSVSRNLGGTIIDGSIDMCTQAFYGELNDLYLINEEGNIRTTLRSRDNRIEKKVELGSDNDKDGIADYWSPFAKWEKANGNDSCNLYQDSNDTSKDGIAIIQSKEHCLSAHDFENISPQKLDIQNFFFTPYPDRDPILSFRNNTVQFQPNVFLYLKINLKDYESYGIENEPTITMQTTASSRIIKDSR